jgi:hypothetical protein
MNASRQGKRLILAIDGRVVARAEDASHQGGHVGFGISPGPGPGPLVSGLAAESGETLDARPILFRPLPSSPILVPTEAWEQDAVYEPSPILDRGLYRMSYSGGWANGGAVNIATSGDGVAWKKAGPGPALGLGEGGEPGRASRSCLMKVDGRYRLYYADQRGDLRLAFSNDGLIFTRSPKPVVDRNALPGLLGWANQGFIQARGAWWMLLEAQHYQEEGPYARGGDWRLHLFRSADKGLTFVPAQKEAVDSLQVGYGTWSSPRPLFRLNGKYHAWYHVAESEHLLPSVIWHAVSDDLQHWRPDPFRTLGVKGSEMDLETADQAADPAMLEINGRVHLYYSVNDNRHGRARIGLAVHEGSLESLAARYPDTATRRRFFPEAGQVSGPKK